MSHPFLTAIYAAARRHLDNARVAQENALVFSLDVYRGGKKGRDARKMRAYWDAKRSMSLRLALETRAKATGLRVEIARVAGAA